MNPILIGLIFAVLSPIIWAFMNNLDNYFVKTRIKKVFSYTILAGIANFTFGFVLALFLDWTSFPLSAIIWPTISGLLYGSMYFAYYFLLKTEDISDLTGLFYLYPILVAILSFFILGEVLPFIGYIGILMILSGALMISLRIHKLSGKLVLKFMFIMILLAGAYEFLVKVATDNMPVWNGVAVEFMAIGLVVFFGLFSRNVRKGIKSELKNLKIAFMIEFFTFLSIAAVFIAMNNLKATIVSSIAAIQPIFALLFERVFERISGKKLTKDERITWRKVIAILLIVIGVAILFGLAGF